VVVVVVVQGREHSILDACFVVKGTPN